jgi:hypothetical protein
MNMTLGLEVIKLFSDFCREFQDFHWSIYILCWFLTNQTPAPSTDYFQEVDPRVVQICFILPSFTVTVQTLVLIFFYRSLKCSMKPYAY